MDHDHNSEPYMEFDFDTKSLSPEETGLPYKIWIDGLGRENKNVPIIRVDIDTTDVYVDDNFILDEHLIPISISDNPVILCDQKLLHFDVVKEWIIKNKKFLLEQVIIEEKITYLYFLSLRNKRETKLPYNIWLDNNGYRRKLYNNRDLPIVRVQIHEGFLHYEKLDIEKEFIAVTISDDPYIVHDLQLPQFDVIRAWIIKYKDALLKHWNGELSDCELIDATTNDEDQ